MKLPISFNPDVLGGTPVLPGPASQFRRCSIILKWENPSMISLLASQRWARTGHWPSWNGQRPVDRNELV